MVARTPSLLGPVICSSDKGVCDGRVQDWALVNVDDLNFVKHLTLPHIDSASISTKYDAGAFRAQAGSKVYEFEELGPGQWDVRKKPETKATPLSQGDTIKLSHTFMPGRIGPIMRPRAAVYGRPEASRRGKMVMHSAP